MTIHDVEQGTDEWLRLRKGRATASQAHRILTPGGKRSEQWRDYALELVAECLCPQEEPDFRGNADTRRGHLLEPVARDVFRQRGHDVREVGFVSFGSAVGISPDGLIHDGFGYVAGLEIKCPRAKTHIEYLLAGELPDKYRPQVHFSMALMRVPWHFVSYCDGIKPLVLEVARDDYTKRMEDEIEAFEKFYKKVYQEVMNKL